MGCNTSQITLLSKENNELRQKIKEYEHPSYLVDNTEKISLYDCIIDIKMCTDITNSGWEVEFPNEEVVTKENFKKIYNKFNSAKAYLSITGAYDKGKTMILNKLCDSNLPCGKKVETRGISFKAMQVKEVTEVLVIDTAGIHSPINLGEITLEEKKNTERKLRDIVFNLSDIFILVVNDFTTLDQEILVKLENKISRSSKKKFKEIYVIHNLKDVTTEEMKNFIWDKQIVKIYSSEDSNCHIETALVQDKKDTGIATYLRTRFTRHIMMINDNSEYGKKFNAMSIGLLKM